MNEVLTPYERAAASISSAAEPPPEGVAFLVRSLTYGGAERQLVALARGLHERGRRVVVLVFYAGGPLEADLRAAGVPVRVIGKNGRWDVRGFLARLFRAVEMERPSVLHGYLDIPNLLGLVLRRRFPGLRVVWGVRASDIDFTRYDWFSRASFRLAGWLSPRADLIVANSRAGERHHVALGFPAEKVIVIPNGIDVERFHPDRAAGQRLRAELGIEPDAMLIGVVGRLDPMKDHPTFLRAAALLGSERPELRFLCVGDGPPEYAAGLHRLAAELGVADRVAWIPARREVTAVYNALDLLCSSSAFGEGFPNVVGEAMACGTRCVVTDVGDSRWIVGDARLVVPAGNPAALARAIRTALDSPPASSERVRKRIVERFSVERLIEATERMLWPAA